MIELTVALPLYKSGKIAWLALESLCDQESIDFEWELLILEEQYGDFFGIEKIKEYVPRLKKAGCANLKYVPIHEWVPLSKKWKLLADLASSTSKCFLLQGADDYSNPNRLKETYDAFCMNKDLSILQSKKGLFYSIKNEVLIEFDSDLYKTMNPPNSKKTALNMAINTNLMKKIKILNFPSFQVDAWLFNNIQIVCEKNTKQFIVEYNNADSWKKGVYTDDANVVSLDREKYYFDCKPPFRKTEIKINNILSKKCLDGLNSIKEKNKKVQNVACLIAAYKRGDILEKCIKSVKNQTFPVDIFIVGSCKEDEEVALKNNCFYLESENRPLSNKWQKGVDHIRDKDKYEALLILGSDDLISKNYVKASLQYLKNEVAVVGKTRWQVLNYDSREKQLYNDFYSFVYNYPTVIEPLGAGRIYSKTFLDRINWQLFYKNNEKLLDTHATMKMFSKKEKIVIMNSPPGLPTNIWNKENFPWYLGYEAPELQKLLREMILFVSNEDTAEAHILSLKDDALGQINGMKKIANTYNYNRQKGLANSFNLEKTSDEFRDNFLKKYFGDKVCVELLA